MAATSSPIGQPIARIDGPLKVTGAAKYAAEFARPRLAYGVLIQSTIANGRVVKIDLSAAKSAPGIIGIKTRHISGRIRMSCEDRVPPARTGSRCRTMMSTMTGNILVSS